MSISGSPSRPTLELHMSGYEGKVKHLSFDKTSRWLATSGGRDACIWDCSGNGPEGRAPAMLPHESPICAVTFQERPRPARHRGAGRRGQPVEPERKQPLRATVKLPTPATKLAWSPDDQYLSPSDQAKASSTCCAPPVKSPR